MRPILSGRVNFPFFLAPMVGLSHVVVRALVRQYLPHGASTFWPTEMMNSRRLHQQDLSQTPISLKEGEERGLVPQILGNEEEPIRRSIRALKEWGAEGIDINMGCPVRKALRHNYGVALMGDPDYAAAVVQMAVKSSSLPVSVKLRSGHQKDTMFLLNFVRGLERAGASWVCLHPREAAQKRRGVADWDQVRVLRSEVGIPVIGNGDVQTSSDALRRLDQTQCDGIMVGRALMARPWLMWQLGEDLGWGPPAGFSGAAPRTPEEEGQEYSRCLFEFIKISKIYFSESFALQRLKFFVRVNHWWLDFGHSVYKICQNAQRLEQVEEELTKYFEDHHLRMTARTNLRE